MQRKFSLLVVLMLGMCLCLLSCRTQKQAHEDPFQREKMRFQSRTEGIIPKHSLPSFNEVQIMSVPVGAKIEWQGQSIGETPVKYTLKTSSRKKPSEFKVIASPVDGGCTQTMLLPADEPLPMFIHFNMFAGCNKPTLQREF